MLTPIMASCAFKALYASIIGCFDQNASFLLPFNSHRIYSHISHQTGQLAGLMEGENIAQNPECVQRESSVVLEDDACTKRE